MPGSRERFHLQMLCYEDRDLSKIYGYQWGDPEMTPNLKVVKRFFVDPFINKDIVALEIGPGGGRWTQYLSKAKHLYVVDVFQELLDETKKNIQSSNVSFIKNNGTDFPEVPFNSIDYVFSFDVFVHLDLDVIEKYLINAKTILKPDGVFFIHYSDKTKYEGFINTGFSLNSPELMNELLHKHSFTVIAENTSMFSNSGFVLFKLKQNEKVFQSGSYPISDSIEYKLDNCNLEETENGK